jgi:hypothetical protein
METLTVAELIDYLKQSQCVDTNVTEVRFMLEPKGKRVFIVTDLSKISFAKLFYQRTFFNGRKND